MQTQSKKSYLLRVAMEMLQIGLLKKLAWSISEITPRPSKIGNLGKVST